MSNGRDIAVITGASRGIGRAVARRLAATHHIVAVARSGTELRALAKEIKGAAYVKVTVEGHTDTVGSEASNQKLSQRRAETVRRWLIESGGLAAAKVEAVGYGEARPVADNGNAQGRARNRRVEIRVRR